MTYPTGSTSISIDVQIVDDNGLPVTGLNASTFPTVTWNPAGPGSDTGISLVDLSFTTSPYSAGGVKERSNGYYRLDLPTAVFVSAGQKRVKGEAAGKHLLTPVIDVGYVPADVRQIISTSLTESVTGNLAGAFAQWFDCTAPFGQTSLNNYLHVSDMYTVWGDVIILASMTENVGGYRFTAQAIDLIPTASENAAGFLTLTDGIETGVTPKQALRGLFSFATGKVTGAGTGTEVFYAPDGSTARITFSPDTSGNRTRTLNL